MNVKLLTDQHLECLSLKGGCIGSSKSTNVNLSTCRGSITNEPLHDKKVLS